ncbi:uncharacterized protein HaLaN_06100 [Haematococcus lacustris]|uniref:RRM domain-containing protein n=1 Tax=Haematococcus lacustris TaxID=44745 RepID=A0A699YV97_HAELA|nr:uncharacterized protein HaLaN_06100 [Haematococcus lacustris]
MLEQSGDLAVRVALGEAAVIAATKAALAEEVHLACLPTSNLLAVLVGSEEEVRALFSRSGPLSRVVLPPSHTLALVEFCEPQDARAAFKGGKANPTVY